MMEKMDGMSMDLTATNIERLKELFPNAVTEGKIDFEILRSILGDDVDASKEKYQFTWNGKAESIKLAQSPSSTTLRPCKEKSKNWDTTENLYIEGDNLEVLKQLQKTYFGKIKMIYIDPPYNTGNDFVYKDDFKYSIEKYKEQTNQTQKSNPDTSGRFHSDWLDLMYPRLILSRNTLCDDGVIFISINDSERDNLKKICDEIFGENNYVSTLVWQQRKGGGNDSKFIAVDHEYILVYSKNINAINERWRIPQSEEYLTRYKESDENGQRYYWDTLVRNGLQSPIVVEIECPDGTFMTINSQWSKERIVSGLEDGSVKFTKSKTGWSLHHKIYMKNGQVLRSLLTEYGNNNMAGKELKDIFGSTLFDYAKPTKLIKTLLSLCTNNDDIIMDFFSGSGTTADSVMQLNCEDGNSRRFIMVQLPEKTDETSEAFKRGFNNICEIGEERIYRAGDKIAKEWKKTNDEKGLFAESSEFDTDIGFKVFKLDSTNINPWDNTNEYDEGTLFNAATIFKIDRSKEDILYEIMLKYGVFDQPASEVDVNEKTMYRVGNRHMVVCLEDQIDDSDILEICKLEPRVVVFKEDGFKDDNAKINAEYNLKKSGVEDVKCI